MRNVLVQGGGPQVQSFHEAAFMNAVSYGQIHPATQVSIDDGVTWVPASVLAQRLRMRGDDGLAALFPMRTETWSTLAGYVAIFSFLFFGGPLSFGAIALGFDGSTGRLGRLAFVAIALVLGPAPIALFGWLGLRAIKRDPTYRGKGRAIFALVIAVIMVLACLVGLVGVVVRARIH